MVFMSNEYTMLLREEVLVLVLLLPLTLYYIPAGVYTPPCMLLLSIDALLLWSYIISKLACSR